MANLDEKQAPLYEGVRDGSQLGLSRYPPRIRRPHINHARTIAELPDEYLADMGPVIKKVAIATGAEHYNVLQNNGKLAFQHVDHVHFHVVPKTDAKDGLVMTVEENWAPRKVGEEQLAATLAKLKSKI
ncbi:hypothetical protein ONZ45_g14580 [Pleurotus djamor]|nr:hypothetical protein ONZ45_g14580 [Pleurotus djamor]